MRKVTRILLASVLLIAGASQSLFAQAASTCGGQTENGDIYPCNPPCSNSSNCTWWAWKEAKDIWGRTLPNWGNAGQPWITGAANSGYIISPVPALNTIAVSSSIGHVAWIDQTPNYSAMQVTVSEQNCGNYPFGTFFSVTRSITWYDGGFIYPPSSGPTPSETGVFPAGPLFHQSSDQPLTIQGSGFSGPVTVYVTFPSGGHGILSGTQITSTSSTSVSILVTLGVSGTYGFQVVNVDGKTSNVITRGVS